jgi:transposase
MGLYVQFQQINFRAWHVAQFVRALLREIPGHLIVLWDGASIHKGPEMDEIAQSYPRVHFERFPAYAPELNPVEQIWRDFKGHMANGLPRTKQDVRLKLHDNTRRARRSQAKLRSFVLASDLPHPFS